MKKLIALSDFRQNLIGTFEISIATIVKIATSPSEKKLNDTKATMISPNVNNNFVLGSDLCKKESNGRYCPKVISFIVYLPFQEGF